MSFVQPSFPIFLAAILLVYWAVRRRRWQNGWLLLCSAVFYGWIHPWFLALLYGSTVLDYAMGRCMARWPSARRRFVVVSVAGNLGLLAVFKYCDFFIANVSNVLGLLGVETSIGLLEIYLPVGISFYTFQTMSYTIDVYRERIEPRTSFLDYAVYVSLFPQLVAGPIERADHLLPQVERPRRLDAARMRDGLTLALWGAAKKICIADTLAPYVDRVFSLPHPSWQLVLVGGIAFSVQILADFSGYTDIARGSARLLGFDLQVNFRHPYLARSPSDFWRRWHVSFSSWIRDYLYIPLGGNRGPWLRVTAVTVLTMLLAGLWHGASWNFVLWGAFHAVLLVAYRLATPRLPSGLVRAPGGAVLAVTLMYLWTCLGWVVFRQRDVGVLWRTLSEPAGADPSWQLVIAVALAALTLATALPLLAALGVERWIWPRLRRGSAALAAQTTLWAVLIAAIYLFAQEVGNDFIYFRF